MSEYGRFTRAIESFQFASRSDIEALNDEIENGNWNEDSERQGRGQYDHDGCGDAVGWAVDEVFERDRYGRLDRAHVLAEAIENAADGRRLEESCARA